MEGRVAFLFGKVDEGRRGLGDFPGGIEVEGVWHLGLLQIMFGLQRRGSDLQFMNHIILTGNKG